MTKKLRSHEEYLEAERRSFEIFDSDDPEEINELNELVDAIIDYEQTHDISEVDGDADYLPQPLRDEWQDILAPYKTQD